MCNTLCDFTKKCDLLDLTNSNQTVPMFIASTNPTLVDMSSILSIGWYLRKRWQLMQICIVVLESIYYRFSRYSSEWDKKIIFGKIIVKLGSNESFSIIVIKLICQFRLALSFDEIIEEIFTATVISLEIESGKWNPIFSFFLWSSILTNDSVKKICFINEKANKISCYCLGMHSIKNSSEILSIYKFSISVISLVSFKKDS